MASNPEVLQDVTDQRDQTGQVQTIRLQNEPVQTFTAQTGGTVNAPLLHGSVFHGPVNFNFGYKADEKEVPGQSTAASSTAAQTGESVNALTAEDQQHCIQLKSTLRHLYERILIGNSQTGHTKFLEDIYTDLIIVENESGGVIHEHEINQIEMSFNRPADKEVCAKCSDLFKVQAGTSKRNRKVLTMGIAGVGKTVSVNKFVLDWAKGEENQDINFVFPLPFRELNLKKEKNFSLIELLNYCFFSSKTGLKSLPKDDGKVLFIFDGLDECHFPLCFEDGEEVKDISEKTSVGSLITNLINRNLLPFALIWITCRPAAGHLIPREHIDLVTEVRGFNDEQKEAYFSKYYNEDMAMKMVSHIKKSRSLHIMCQIPVFCWISATVLQPLMVQDSNKDIPTTLTAMYISFLLKQKNLMKKKYSEKTTTVDAEHIILKLGELAFCNLESGTLIFCEGDLMKCGIDVSDGTVFSGVCTQIFSQQEGVSERNIFSFVHLSVQESLAALYVHYSHSNKKRDAFKQDTFLNKLKRKNKRITDLHKFAVERALQNEKGHLDLFLRFLLGLSLEDSRHVLTELLPNLKIKAESVKDTADYIKKKLHEEMSFDRNMNLFHCLSELKDNSLTTEIQKYLNSGDLSKRKLSSPQWSALVFVLLMSGETQEKFELKKYMPLEEGLNRLLPVLKNTRCAILASCNLGIKACEDLKSVLNQPNSSLKELDLSNNELLDSGVELLSGGLKSSHCKLEILRLPWCNLGKKTCDHLESVLKLETSFLKELDISNNDLQDSAVEILSSGLKSSHCKLEILRIALCNLGKKTCDHLESVLKLETSSLKELDISNNDLQDSGVEVLSGGLKSSHCKLEILRLSGCMITEVGCSALVLALSSNPTHLKELDLTYNHPGESGLKLLSARLEDPHCSLNTLSVEHGGEIRIKPGLKKYSCEFTLDPNTAHRKLSLSDGNRKVTKVRSSRSYPEHPERFDYCTQVLCGESVTGRCYWEAEWSGREAEVALTYKSISRKGGSYDSEFGGNEKSWSLICSDNSYSVYHNKNSTAVSAPPSSCKRVGVYVDCPAGTLSFYSISSDTHTLIRLHTFNTTFTEPLYAGFRVDHQDNSVYMCV
ncbi:NACHT, LRR and PYD domains-containing protein 12-like [Colossoma macropomum]|uniref:NACHT, LRR and PYD domains-containing protein 12-like n=1 Tax=Colossoma macropomum TaxID=42526 RepID=UPI001863CD27|nr:NACHT, LRR and PYD domains-containing protein 12-like [Colossoma macropomum]